MVQCLLRRLPPPGMTIPVGLIAFGVELRFRGAARAKWREYVNEGVRRTEIEHEKEEIYFDDRFCLWGKAKSDPLASGSDSCCGSGVVNGVVGGGGGGGGGVSVVSAVGGDADDGCPAVGAVSDDGRWESREVLKRGRHLFPFQYKLPEGIPCSFEGPEASVRYTVHGLLARTSGADMTTQRHVTVLRDLDSKKDSEKRTPSPRHALEDHAERSFSSTCCRPGRVACSLSVLKRSYVPGETIRADVHIHNSSMRRSGVCRLQLKQLLTYGESYTQALVLQEVRLHDCLRRGQRRQWRDVSMLVPPTCPSRLSKCRVIDVRYCVAVEAVFPDAVLYAAVPVTIVTVPERGIIPIRWSYKECLPFGDVDSLLDGGGAAHNPLTDAHDPNDPHDSQDRDFRPKYKFYEEVRDSRKDRFLILKLRQSPGIRRRQILGSPEPGESRTDTTFTDGVGESQA